MNCLTEASNLDKPNNDTEYGTRMIYKQVIEMTGRNTSRVMVQLVSATNSILVLLFLKNMYSPIQYECLAVQATRITFINSG